MRTTYHQVSVEDCVADLASDVSEGLSSIVAEQRQTQYGLNRIDRQKPTPVWRLVFRQLTSPFVFLLLFATILSMLFDEMLDASAIAAVIVINTILGFVMEYRAQVSLESLRKMTIITTRVLRDCVAGEIDSERLVPGDVAFVESGDLIPADARIIQSSGLQTNESALTGESVPVEKWNRIVTADTILAERVNMVYQGTFVSRGSAWVLITATGMKTELGQIAKQIQIAKPVATPLERKIEVFTKRLTWVTIAMVAVILTVGIVFDRPLIHLIETSIALAVAAIPEGLPIVTTLSLAHGMLLMAKQNVLIKKLSAVETLGGTNVICTDKTGTLTANRMEVAIVSTDADSFSLSEPPRLESHLTNRILQIGVLCNNASVNVEGAISNEIGDPIESALLILAQKYTFDIYATKAQYPKLQEVPFDPEVRMMATIHSTNVYNLICVKGAPESVLDSCVDVETTESSELLDEERRAKWTNKADSLANHGYRVLGFAYAQRDMREEHTVFSHLTFVGLVAMVDPLREDVHPAIAECHNAGIDVVMITGDHPTTALRVASELGMHVQADIDPVIGAEMHSLGDMPAAEKDRLLNAHVFARVSPTQKLDLVHIHQLEGSIVGMTGDGVNDAPALKKADIGIAMGIRGTQISQDAADIVLKDDSFVSIVSAVRQGRIIFENIRRFVKYLLSCNISELMVVSSASIFNLHFQLQPIQILFINLITDVLPALALAMTPGNADIMRVPPRSPNEPVIDTSGWRAIFVYSSVMACTCIAVVLLGHMFMHPEEGVNNAHCSNVLFLSMMSVQLIHIFNMGGLDRGFLNNEVVRNKYVWLAIAMCLVILVFALSMPATRSALSVTALKPVDWIVISAGSALSFGIIFLIRRIGLIR